MTLLATIAKHFDADKLRVIEVPEWGTPAVLDAKGKETTPAKPLRIHYLAVTLDDMALIAEMDGTSFDKQVARVVALKALDADGKRLFKTIDAVQLRKVAAPDVVKRVAIEMLGRNSLDEDQIEKN